MNVGRRPFCTSSLSLPRTIRRYHNSGAYIRAYRGFPVSWSTSCCLPGPAPPAPRPDTLPALLDAGDEVAERCDFLSCSRLSEFLNHLQHSRIGGRRRQEKIAVKLILRLSRRDRCRTVPLVAGLVSGSLDHVRSSSNDTRRLVPMTPSSSFCRAVVGADSSSLA